MLGVPALKLNAMVSSPAAPMPQFPLAGVPLAVKIASGKVQNASLVVWSATVLTIMVVA